MTEAFTPDKLRSEAQAAQEVQPKKMIDLDDGKKPYSGAITDNHKPQKLDCCPACGCKLEAEELVPTDKEKEDWLSHVLGEDRFRQSYTLFNGRVVVTLRSRTTHENDQIFQQLNNEIKATGGMLIGGYASPAYVARMNRLMLTCSMERLVMRSPGKPDEGKTYPEVTAENYPTEDGALPIEVAHRAIIGKLSEGLVTALMAQHMRFMALTTVMIRHSDDPDFWQPAVAAD